jgi:hypothetical protein
MRKHMGDRALLQDVAAAPDKLLIEPCSPDLERIDAVPHWKLARWFVGLGQVRGVTPEWASSYADRVPGEAGTRLNRAFKIYRASKLLWPGDSVLVAEFIRCLPELGLTMHSGSAARAEAVAAPAAPEAPDSASAPAAGLTRAVAVPAESVRVRTPTVRQAIAPYVAKLMKEHPEYTANALYRRMRRDAGEDGSPFAKLGGGELFCVEASRPCGISTVASALTEYRKSIRRPHAPR